MDGLRAIATSSTSSTVESVTAQRPQYGWVHRRYRAALLASGAWINTPCPRCGLVLVWDDRDALDLDHKTDQFGRMLPFEYNGMAHRRCNQAANAFGKNKAGSRRPALSAVPAPGKKSPGRVWLAGFPDCVVAHSGG